MTEKQVCDAMMNLYKLYAEQLAEEKGINVNVNVKVKRTEKAC